MDLGCKYIYLSGFSFAETGDSQDSRRRDHIYPSLPFSPTLEHSDIFGTFAYEKNMFLITARAFTTLLLSNIISLLEFRI